METQQPTPSSIWDPSQYARFADHRSRPFFDLVDRIRAAGPRTVVDLGCGSGELTATLADRWPSARVLGVDNSAEMLAGAAQHTARYDGRLSFADGDLADYLPDESTEVVVSNAAYQWIDGHEAVLARIAERLPAGGTLAVQVPGNFSAPSHRMIRELVAEPRWAQATDGLQLRTDPVLEPAGYVDLLARAGLVPDVWETTYLQVLPDEDPVLEWVKGTALRPVLAALSADLHTKFLAELGGMLRAAYPARDYGTVFGFRRIFLVGHRPS